MAIAIYAHANADDALIAWRPAPWPTEWIGCALWKRDLKTGTESPINNRIPPKKGGTSVPIDGLSSLVSPIRRCIWYDHSINAGDHVQYRVIPMVPAGSSFKTVDDAASDWSDPIDATTAAGDGLSAAFNRGIIMSQVVSRLVGDEISPARLKKFKDELAAPGFPARRYLAGQVRHELLDFLAAAHQRGSDIYGALYEVNDDELVKGIEAFGPSAHILIGNGSATPSGMAKRLEKAHVVVKERDLSKAGRSSPSVHNKFIVEVDKHSGPVRVLTGSTNWTTTGLCTQLNNTLVIERPEIAVRFRKQWDLLVKAHDDMPDSLIASNSKETEDPPVSVIFSAAKDHVDLAEAEELIRAAKQGLFFLNYTPGQSPLLNALLDRSQGAHGPYVRGVVSEVRESKNGKIIEHGVRVVRRGEEKLFREHPLLPSGISANAPSWAKEEFTRRMFFPAGLMAIVHSKVIVADPFSDNCAVVTGSHNFSTSASEKNDENLVIIRGNKRLAEIYALHIQVVYDHYSWRAFLSEGGDPNVLYGGLSGWRSGAKARDLSFWMQDFTP